MVLHDINQACRYADHLVAVRDGRVYAAGPPGGDRRRRLHPRRVRPARRGRRGPRDRDPAVPAHLPAKEDQMRLLTRLAVVLAALALAACGSDEEIGRRAVEHRDQGVPGDRAAQVRHDDDRARAQAGRDRRLHRPGRRPRARRRAGRRRRLPRRLQVAQAAVGAEGARRRQARRRRGPGDQLRGGRRAAAGPHHRDQRRPEEERLRPALADRADRRAVRRLHRLRHAVGGPDAARRPRARARGAGPQGGGRRQGEVREGPQASTRSSPARPRSWPTVARTGTARTRRRTRAAASSPSSASRPLAASTSSPARASSPRSARSSSGSSTRTSWSCTARRRRSRATPSSRA